MRVSNDKSSMKMGIKQLTEYKMLMFRPCSCGHKYNIVFFLNMPVIARKL